MKTALVTGAGGGMGRAMVELLREQGYLVFALDLKACEAGEGIVPVACDVTSEESVLAAVATVKSLTDKLDAIIHFAGIYTLDSFVEMSTQTYEKMFDVNVLGAFLINKSFLPLLQRGSKILITTSELATLDRLPFTGIYAVTKAALDKYAYSLRMELQLLGITVCVLRAGAVDTGMLGASMTALDRFVEKTQLYSCNAKRFKSIVNKVESRNVSPRKIAKKSLRIIERRKPKFAFSINRNPLLCLLNSLPKSTQLWAIKQVLK